MPSNLFTSFIGSNISKEFKKYLWMCRPQDVWHNLTISPLHKYHKAVLWQETLFQITCALALIAVVSWWIRFHKCRYLLRSSLLLYCANWFLRQMKEELSLFTLFGLDSTCHTFAALFHGYSYEVVNATLIIILFFFRCYWIYPLSIVKDTDSVGYDHLKRVAKRRKTTLNQILTRDPGSLPPVFPNGWIALIESRELPTGAVQPVSALGHEFCVFRGDDGQAYVVDAYCPHLGANLAAGGRVVGSCIECPFHGWMFNGEDGRCSKIPYSSIVPEVARTKTWRTCEMNGFVFIWFHASDEPPSWDMIPIALVEEKKWVYRGRTDHTIRCHIQEIPENGADVQHLPHLHSKFVALGPAPSSPSSAEKMLVHDWQPQWHPDEHQQHVARMSLRHELRLWGIRVPMTFIDLDVQQIGPACVHLFFNSYFGRGVMVQSITPEGPLRQRVIHHMYTEPRYKQLAANLLLIGEEIMISRDIAMWNNKKFIRNPILVKEDRLISRYRRWYTQFYSEDSPTLEEVRERTLDW